MVSRQGWTDTKCPLARRLGLSLFEAETRGWEIYRANVIKKNVNNINNMTVSVTKKSEWNLSRGFFRFFHWRFFFI